jgi:hypothetical protein
MPAAGVWRSLTVLFPLFILPNGGSPRPSPTLRRGTVKCATALNLQTQIAPLIVLMECQGRMLEIMKPLIEIINNLPNPPLQSTSGIQQGRRRSRSVPVEHDSCIANSVSPGCALPSDKEPELSSREPDICSGKGPTIALYLTHIRQQWGCWISQAVFSGRLDYRFPKHLRCQVALTRHR